MSEEHPAKRRNLGRGLSALLGEIAVGVDDGPGPAASGGAGGAGEAGHRAVRSLPIERLKPGKYQPRRHFDDETIGDLVDSIRHKGIISPLVVRPHPTEPETYEIICGERRWRAGQRAGLHDVPVVVRNLSDREALEVALVENLQREDLSPLEEADGYQRLMAEFSHTQEELARAVGKSRSHVANMMRLLGLPEPVKLMLEGRELTAGHARALLTASDPVGMARAVIDRGLNVRQTEKLVHEPQASPRKPGRRKVDEGKDPDTAALERDLADQLGLKVAIRHSGRGGELVIQYGTLEQLDDVLSRLSQAPRRGKGEVAA